MDIGCILFYGECQKFFHVYHVLFSPSFIL
jgi:hypothetical protein